MATLVLGRRLKTSTPVVEVQPGLSAGRYRAELVVVDEAEVASEPVMLDFVVRGEPAPPVPPAPPGPVRARPPRRRRTAGGGT